MKKSYFKRVPCRFIKIGGLRCHCCRLSKSKKESRVLFSRQSRRKMKILLTKEFEDDILEEYE